MIGKMPVPPLLPEIWHRIYERGTYGKHSPCVHGGFFRWLLSSTLIHLDDHVAYDVRSFVHPVRTPVEMPVDFSEAEHNVWIVS
jgi:hypothetical protein